MAFTTGTPFRGNDNASGGYLLPPEQGEILVNGILVETGAIQIAGDARGTNSRRTNFPIWLGRPTAGPVGEGAAKPVTGASLGQGSLSISKFASIVLFTDEQIEDMMNGDLNVLVDAGVRQALSVSVDGHALGLIGGSSLNQAAVATASTFDTTLVSAATQALSGSPVAPSVTAPGSSVILDTLSGDAERLQKGVSASMGILEANGYGNPTDMGVLLGFGFQQELRDARDSYGRPLYDGGTFAGQSIDALYGLDRAHTTNLAATKQSTAVAGSISTGGVLTTTAISGTLTPGAPVFVSGTLLGYVGATITGTSPALTAQLVGPTGTNITSSAVASGITVGQPVAVVAHKPNIHVRVRSDISVSASNEASIVMPDASRVDLFQDNLTAIRYEMRIGYYIHDVARAIVPVWSQG